MIRDYRDIELTVERPTPIDKEVVWDKSKVIISETDVYGRITNVNDVFCTVCGYTAAEMIGQPHSIIRHPDMPKITFKLLWDNLKLGNNFAGVVKNLAKSGEYYWVITDFEMRRDSAGNITHYIARRKSVPKGVIDNYVAPLYQTLVKLEKVGGMDLSARFFKNYLDKQGKDYIDFIIDVMNENREDVAFQDIPMAPMDSNKVISDDRNGKRCYERKTQEFLWQIVFIIRRWNYKIIIIKKKVNSMSDFTNPIPTIERPTPIDREVQWDKTKTLISETDVKGTITNVNDVFCAVAHYSASELIGQPHNLIRHPDMPKLIFKLLWDNLKVGNNFVGVIKNLAKTGEYYWVVTDFEMRRDAMGNITHYIGRRKSVPEAAINNYLAPFYESLLKMEKIGGVELSSRFFKNYLTKQGKDYIDFVISIMSENQNAFTAETVNSIDNNNVSVSDNIYHVDQSMNEKRKNFFERLFS